MSQMSSNNGRAVTRKRSYPSTTTTAMISGKNLLLQNITGSSYSSSPSSSSSSSSSFVTTPSDGQTSPYPGGKKKKKEKRKQSEEQEQQLDLYSTLPISQSQQIAADLSNGSMDTDVLNVPHKLSSQRSVPAFLHKLFNMVEDPSTTQLIRWSKDGNSFLVEGHEEFAKSVLPRFYKHNTFASFVRQLNMYDFHKIPHIQQDVLITSNNTENEVWEFSNPHFQRSRPDLLVLVTRKRNRDRDDIVTDPAGKVNLGSLVKEITAIRKHQTNITADLRNLHRDNEIIWKETLAAREKHQKHQQIISKILQFLTAVFSNEQHQLDNIILGNENSQIEQQQQLPSSSSSSDPSSQTPPSFIYHQNNINQHHHHQQNNYYFLPNNVHTANSSGNSSGSDNNGRMTVAGFPSNVPASNPSARDSHKASNKSKDRNSESMHSNIKQEILNAPTSTLLSSPYASSSAFNSGATTTAHSKPPFNVSRSAEAITNDIDELQANVETLAAQLGIDPAQFPEKVGDFGQFTDNYSTMISSASNNDKLRLFELADDSNQCVGTPNGSPQMQPRSSSPPHQSPMPLHTQPPNNPEAAAAVTDPTNPLSFFYRQLLKSADPYHPDPSFTCDTNPGAAAAAHVNTIDNIIPSNMNTVYQSNPNPRVTNTTATVAAVAVSLGIAMNNIHQQPSPSIIMPPTLTKQQFASHHGTPNAAIVDTNNTTSPYASPMYHNNKNTHHAAAANINMEEVQAHARKAQEAAHQLFRNSVLNHQQLQDQRFHHLQLSPSTISRQNSFGSKSKPTSLTTTPTAFFDQQLQQQQAYFRNQYPIANHPQSPIVVPPPPLQLSSEPQQQAVFHPMTPTPTPSSSTNHHQSFHPPPYANQLEQIGQMNISNINSNNNTNFTQQLVDVAAANSMTNYMNQSNNEKEDGTIVY